MHSWRVWVLAHAELGTAVFHCLFSLVPPGCYFPLDILSTISYVVCKHIVKMHLSTKGLHLTDETRRRTRCQKNRKSSRGPPRGKRSPFESARSEEHTSELQSQSNLVCRLLLEKKKTQV